MAGRDKYGKALREARTALIKRLFTETNMTVPCISAEAHISTASIWDLARNLGWSRPPRPKGSPNRPNITAHQYRRRYLAEIGILQAGQVAVSPKVKDPFDISGRAAVADQKEQRRIRKEQGRAQTLKLWNDGLDMQTIARRLLLSYGVVRRILKASGADLKAPRHTYEATPAHLFIRGGGMSPKARGGDWQRRT